MKKSAIALLAGLILTGQVSAASIPSSEKSKANLFFAASSPKENSSNYNPQLPNLTLMSAKVTAPTSCRGNVGLSITNAFTDGTLKKIYDNFQGIVTQMASTSGAIYLASLYISKSNPQLYQLITEGVDLGMDDFLSAMGSCEAMANSVIENVADPLIQMQRKTKLNKIIEENATVALDQDWNHIKAGDVANGVWDGLSDAGITIFGQTKGGAGQQELDVVKDTIHIGWCLYRGMSKTQCENYYSGNPGTSDLPMSSDEQKILFENIDDFKRNAVMILGTQYIAICQGCNSITVSGVGILGWIEKTRNDIESIIKAQTLQPIENLTVNDYKLVGFGNKIIADANYYRNLAALEAKDMTIRNNTIRGWAYDVAYSRAIATLNELEASIYAVKSAPETETAGLVPIQNNLMDEIDRQRKILDAEAKSNEYTPKMYIKMLLSVTENIAKGQSLFTASNGQ